MITLTNKSNIVYGEMSDNSKTYPKVDLFPTEKSGDFVLSLSTDSIEIKEVEIVAESKPFIYHDPDPPKLIKYINCASANIISQKKKVINVPGKNFIKHEASNKKIMKQIASMLYMQDHFVDRAIQYIDDDPVKDFCGLKFDEDQRIKFDLDGINDLILMQTSGNTNEKGVMISGKDIHSVLDDKDKYLTGKKKLIISRNPVDMLLISTACSWSSCTSMRSEYNYGWAAAVMNLDHSRCVIFISNEDKRKVSLPFGELVAPKMAGRALSLQSIYGEAMVGRGYPNEGGGRRSDGPASTIIREALKALGVKTAKKGISKAFNGDIGHPSLITGRPFGIYLDYEWPWLDAPTRDVYMLHQVLGGSGTEFVGTKLCERDITMMDHLENPWSDIKYISKTGIILCHSCEESLNGYNFRFSCNECIPSHIVPCKICGETKAYKDNVRLDGHDSLCLDCLKKVVYKK